MKILMLGWELPPHISGGLGVACYNMCKALAQDGVSIDFVVPYNADHPDVTFMNVLGSVPISAAEMMKVYGGAYDSRYFALQNDAQKAAVDPSHIPKDLHDLRLEYLHSVKKLTHNKKEQYSAIHAHDWLTYDAAIAAKEALGCPLIAHVHATEFDRSGEHAGNPLVHEIEYNGLLFADKIIAVSNATKQLIVREYNIPADKIEVVHNSINPHEYAPLQSANAYTYLTHMKQKGYTVAVTTSRLTIQKGLTHLLRAAQLAIQKNPKILFVLAGSGDQYHELIALSAELGISENVIFTGWVNGKLLRDTYDIADLFIMSSVSEPFGITALEAVAHGSPTLISRQSGVSEVLRNTLKFDYWNHMQLADQILALAEQPVLRQTLRENAADEFQKFSWSDVAKKCTAIYHKTAAGALA